MAHAYYLAGDSYPRDSEVETALTHRLTRLGIEVISQARINALSGVAFAGRTPSQRVAALRRVVADADRADAPFLIGRSSGAWTATLYARNRGAQGVVCLGYPFRQPKHTIEPRRFTHLARLRVPTLIIQGKEDLYGGRALTLDYSLSPAITLHFVPGGHALKLSDTRWDTVAALAMQLVFAAA